MFQPFIPLRPFMINRLVELKKYYLVTQIYRRARNPFEEEHKVDLLVSAYNDLGLARGHLSALKTDRYGAIIHLTDAGHRDKLISLFSPESSYRLFWAVIQNGQQMQERLLAKYRAHMQRYITRNTDWRISRDTTINPKLELIYGELFITLQHKRQARRITFEELEKS